MMAITLTGKDTPRVIELGNQLAHQKRFTPYLVEAYPQWSDEVATQRERQPITQTSQQAASRAIVDHQYRFAHSA